MRFSEMPDVGDIVHCRACSSGFEVVSINPIELDWPFDLDDEEEEGDDDHSEFGVFPDEEEEDDDLDEDLDDEVEDDY
jgi:hypothetical protein